MLAEVSISETPRVVFFALYILLKGSLLHLIEAEHGAN